MPELILTDQNFEEEVIKNDKLVLVDFWLPGCGPCSAMMPVIKEIAKEFAGKAKVGKLNVFENSETAQHYKIIGVPTIIIFKKGEAVERATGLRPKQVIIDKLNSLL